MKFARSMILATGLGMTLGALPPALFADDKAPSVVDSQEKERIVALLADATDRAFNGKGLGQVLDLVAKADRERVGNTLDRAENEQFTAAADKVARLWREKYNHNFDASENRQAMQLLGIERSRDEQGRERAVVSFPAQGGRSRFDVRMVREGTNDWRILLPDDVTANNFAGRMAKSMELIANQHAANKWPDNRSDAYLNVSAQVLHTLASSTARTADTRD